MPGPQLSTNIRTATGSRLGDLLPCVVDDLVRDLEHRRELVAAVEFVVAITHEVEAIVLTIRRMQPFRAGR